MQTRLFFLLFFSHWLLVSALPEIRRFFLIGALDELNRWRPAGSTLVGHVTIFLGLNFKNNEE